MERGGKNHTFKTLVAFPHDFHFEWKGAEVRWSFQNFFHTFNSHIRKEPVSQLTCTVDVARKALITFAMEKNENACASRFSNYKL